MYNKILTDNHAYRRLRMFTGLLFLIAVVLAAELIFLGLDNSRNLNGDVYQASGTVTYAGKDKDNYYVIVLDGDAIYMANLLSKHFDGWNSLQGQYVTLFVPQSQFEQKNKSVLGIQIDDRVVVDCNDVIAAMREGNQKAMILFGVLTGVFVVASGVVYFYQKKTDPAVETDLCHAYCEYMSTRQPSCAAYRKLSYVSLAYALFLGLYITVALIVDEYIYNMPTKIAIDVILSLLMLMDTAGYLAFGLWWLPKKEREFYATHYPFDLSDISHVIMNKKMKIRLQSELKNERETYPDRYVDGGNGYLVDFDANGVRLSVENSEESVPSAQEVFGEGGDISNGNQTLCKLSYAQLNLEAVPHYRKKDRPLIVVVKSRLEKTDALPQDMMNDIFILFDKNLLKTLRKFDVQVENLDEILKNKATLIQENCKRKSVK